MAVDFTVRNDEATDVTGRPEPPGGLRYGFLYSADPGSLLGCARKVHDGDPYDQNHGQFVLLWVRDPADGNERRLLMADTYHLSCSAVWDLAYEGEEGADGWDRYDKMLVWLRRLSEGGVSRATAHEVYWDCYYNASCWVSDRMVAGKFEEMADLSEFRHLHDAGDEGAADYDWHDVVRGVRPYREAGFREYGGAGFDLVRVGAEPLVGKKARRLAERAVCGTRIGSSSLDMRKAAEMEAYALAHMGDPEALDALESMRMGLRDALEDDAARRARSASRAIPAGQERLDLGSEFADDGDGGDGD